MDGKRDLRKLEKGARLRYEGRAFFSVSVGSEEVVGVLAPLAGGVVLSTGSSVCLLAFGVVPPLLAVASTSGSCGDSGRGDSKLDIDMTDDGGRCIVLQYA